MLELVHLDLPGTSSGWTLRRPDRLLRREHVEFPTAGGRVLLFREMADVRDFLRSDAYWGDLVSFDGRELDPERAHRYNLWRMVDGTLRWGAEAATDPCSELCVELAFHCESVELLDELGPHRDSLHGVMDVSTWRRIIPVLVSLVRFRDDPAESVNAEAIRSAIRAGFFHGPWFPDPVAHRRGTRVRGRRTRSPARRPRDSPPPGSTSTAALEHGPASRELAFHQRA